MEGAEKSGHIVALVCVGVKRLMTDWTSPDIGLDEGVILRDEAESGGVVLSGLAETVEALGVRTDLELGGSEALEPCQSSLEARRETSSGADGRDLLSGRLALGFESPQTGREQRGLGQLSQRADELGRCGVCRGEEGEVALGLHGLVSSGAEGGAQGGLALELGESLPQPCCKRSGSGVSSLKLLRGLELGLGALELRLECGQTLEAEEAGS